MSKKYYVLSQNDLYEEKRHPLFTTYQKVELPKYEELSPEWNGKKIPLTMWQEILAFMKHSYDVLKSETMLFLYYDENKKQPWSFWVPPQITSGMTVKSDPEHINFQVQRAQHPDIMFGTVHHHCSTSAFQSGTDEADETNREGFHFTIGNLNKPTDIDIHFRWCLDNECHELDDLSMVIDGAMSPFKKNIELTDDMLAVEQDYMNQQLYKIPDLTKFDFTSYMDNVSKPKFPAYTTKSKARSIGYFDTNSWWDDHPYNTAKSKKNSTESEGVNELDVVDEMVFNSLYDFEFEEKLLDYVTQTGGDDAEISTIRTGQIEDTRIAHHMYSAYIKQITCPFYKLVDKLLDKYSGQFGIDKQQLVIKLEEYQNEERITI
jgi:hypothetical protein